MRTSGIVPWSKGLPCALAALGLCLPVPAYAQLLGSVAGSVTDEGTGGPIAGARVVVVGTSLQTMTNAAGVYAIENVPTGNHNVLVSAQDYATVTVPDQVVLTTPGTTVDVALPLLLRILRGTLRQLTADVRDARGTPIVDRQITWSSTNPSVASVDAYGRVRGVAQGAAVIVARSEARSDSIDVAVFTSGSIPFP